ncbi:hypothetical protein [Cognatishimia sp. MH4019]|uniref:hypothetical protein n=1 Tax=Cognatishimia sp. MH4019 TaxID=2854030 RepID=UPI001CD20186|nr:hypothetical protein [Cognatishimia sp. MH4019]
MFLLIIGAPDVRAQAQQADQTQQAFKNFLAQGDYNNANFYLQNGLINPEQLDTGQMFYDILHAQYWQTLNGPNQKVAVLHDYLGKLKAFDINQEMTCDWRNGRVQSRCTLLNDLAASKSAVTLAFFADLRLDLNKTFPKRTAATFDVIHRLGTSFSLADIQMLSQKGMIFGDEVYEPVALAAHYEINNTVSLHRNVPRGQSLQMPDNYLSLNQLNFMDVLIVALGNQQGYRQTSEASARDALLCQYVTFVAAQMRPSFDYLGFVLLKRDTFRAAQIGERVRARNAIYEPFPPACVSLIAGMAQNHARINDVMSLFAARGDVETASWLLSLKAPATAATGATGTTINQ